MEKCIENHNQDDDEQNGKYTEMGSSLSTILLLICSFYFLWFLESTEHILNELEDLFQSLVRRMNKSEMEDFELVIVSSQVLESRLSC